MLAQPAADHPRYHRRRDELLAFHAPNAFDDEQQQRCAIFAAQAAGTMQLATRHQDDTELRVQLEEALTSRAVIDQAIGILIGRHRYSADDAFADLRQQSIDANQKLRDVASDLVQRTSGHTPTDGNRFQTRREPPAHEG